MIKFTVSELLRLADQARKEVEQGTLDLNSQVNISLEVCKEDDEDTYGHRVFGSELIESSVSKQLVGKGYVHIQLIGNPNFEIYSKTEPVNHPKLKM